MKKVFKGNITIENLHIMKDYDVIDGYVDLAYSDITEFYQTAEINGYLDLSHTNITEFKQTAKIGGSLYLRCTNIKEFKQKYKIGKDIYADIKIEKDLKFLVKKNDPIKPKISRIKSLEINFGKFPRIYKVDDILIKEIKYNNVFSSFDIIGINEKIIARIENCPVIITYF